MKIQREKIMYVLGVLRTHQPGGKAIIKSRRRKGGSLELRKEGKETATCLHRTICGKRGWGGSRTITLLGI